MCSVVVFFILIEFFPFCSVDRVVFSAFSSPNDVIKNCAALALGNITVGALDTYVLILLYLAYYHLSITYLIWCLFIFFFCVCVGNLCCQKILTFSAEAVEKFKG